MTSRPLGDLVRAAATDPAAFQELVSEFSRMVWSVARAHRLDVHDAADVCQTVWLRLATHVTTIRDPDTIAGWLKTTARHECLSLLRARGRTVPFEQDGADGPDHRSAPLDVGLVAEERHAAFWEAFSSLPDQCQALLRLLLCDPPMTYAEVSEILGIPHGSIGPTRQRCIQRLRNHPAIARITDDGDDSPGTWGQRDD